MAQKEKIAEDRYLRTGCEDEDIRLLYTGVLHNVNSSCISIISKLIILYGRRLIYKILFNTE